MPRTSITAVAAPGTYASAGVALTGAAADVSNKNQFVFTGRDLVIAYNSGLSTRTITITSIADRYGRTGHITTENITTLQHRMYGPFTNAEGWKQSDGYFYLEASHADVNFYIVTLPATN